jgi:penicillin-binding protein 2
LANTHGIEQIEVDSKYNIVKVLVKEENRDPVAGNDLVLNLDMDLQQKTAEYLRAGIDKATGLVGSEITGGAAIVMDVNTGGILSLVSFPDYDNNLFSGGISTNDYKKLIEDDHKPMFNRAVNGVYPPGSISKIILASAGLQEGAISKNTAFDTPPAITIGDYTFPDNKDHGYTDITRAIAESNNIFFYAIGGGFEQIKGIGIDKIKQYWEKFGLGEPTGIDLPCESSGLLPDPS